MKWKERQGREKKGLGKASEGNTRGVPNWPAFTHMDEISQQFVTLTEQSVCGYTWAETGCERKVSCLIEHY